MSPSKPRNSAMTPAQFRDLLAKYDLNQSEAAKILNIHRNTVARWLNGTTPIDEAAKLLIWAKIGR